ncbi:MAG: hypothetical protein R3E67_01840 [Pseudomonadales bacterium]
MTWWMYSLHDKKRKKPYASLAAMNPTPWIAILTIVTMDTQEPSRLIENTQKIAVIQASGEIVDGYQPSGTVGSETLVALIRAAWEDKKTAAIVLRIDSRRQRLCRRTHSQRTGCCAKQPENRWLHP